MQDPNREPKVLDLVSVLGYSKVVDYSNDLFHSVCSAINYLKGESLSVPDAITTALVLREIADTLLDNIGFDS